MLPFQGGDESSILSWDANHINALIGQFGRVASLKIWKLSVRVRLGAPLSGRCRFDLSKTKKGYIMINKIYIPTVCRVDNQITYNNLPKELQKKVVFVVQEWERNQYKFDAEYYVLPSDITIGSKNALA